MTPIWLQSSDLPFEVLAIGASAGGLRAVQTILADLGADFPVPILVAQHRAPGATKIYRRLLQRRTNFRVEEAREGEVLARGTIYVAPDGCHLELARDATVRTPPLDDRDYVRPSVDRLFASIAESHAERAVAVVLTGYGRDGAKGVGAVRHRGGFVIAQDAGSSEHFGMPASAIETRRVDLVLPLRHIAFALAAIFDGAPAGALS